ncbi:MAG: pentapeptide repeat-containing protein [Candidatus Nanopelagicales bacterium]
MAYANLTGADLSGAILTDAQLYCATMPDGKINNSGCP